MEQLGILAGNLPLEFFAHLFEHFCAYLRRQCANRCELGITGKSLFLLRKLSIDDANFGQK